MKKYKRLTQEEKSSIIEDYRRGIPIRVMCENYGVSRFAINAAVKGVIPPDMRRYGGKQRKKLLSNDEIDMLVEDRVRGLTYQELAEKYGVSETTVYHYIPPTYKKRQSEKDVRFERALLEYVEGRNPHMSICRRYHTDNVRVLKVAHDKFPENFRRFDAEFRKKVVFDAIGSSVRAAALLYGVCAGTVRTWLRQYEEGTLNNMKQYHRKKNVSIPNKNDGIAEKEYPNLVSLG